MADVILVLNAGSSSLKFCVSDEEGSDLIVHGQVEGLYTAPHFVATSNGGGSASKEWGEGVVRDAAWLSAELDPARERGGLPAHQRGVEPAAGMGDPDHNEERMIARHTRAVIGAAT
jgi:hypothetical protein